MYRDLAIRHRPTEVRAILGSLDGALVRRTAELIAAIEDGQRTCTRANLDLLAAYERLERLGRPLNAVVVGDRRPGPRRRGAAGRAAGRGQGHHRGGGRADHAAAARPATRRPPRATPTLVARLRAAGAEVFATTQCLEYAAGFAHPDIGDTRNPRDPSRTSGGSSGGSAALVAAGVCDLAVGTDTGGSIRIPAAYCGIVGLKPTAAWCPVDGVFPLSPSLRPRGHADRHRGTAPSPACWRCWPAGPRAGRGRRQAAGRRPPAVRRADRTAVRPVGDARGARRLDRAHWPARRGRLGLRELNAPWLDELAGWEEPLAVIVAREAATCTRAGTPAATREGTRALLAFGARSREDGTRRALARRAELTAAVDASLAGVDVLAGPTVGYMAPEQDPPFGVGDDHGRAASPGRTT